MSAFFISRKLFFSWLGSQCHRRTGPAQPKVYVCSQKVSLTKVSKIGGRVYRLVLVCTLIATKENMANTVATPERATEWIATYIKEKKHTPGKRSLAKQYREEFFIEYSAGEMTPEKKAFITSIFCSNFFLPVDRFDSECQQGATYLAWKAREEG
jgi:hypothetical protein